MSRWPQSAITRSGAPRRRAYSMPSESGTQLSWPPQRQRQGQRTRSRSCRGSVAISARPAETVSVCSAGPERNASAISGSRPGGSATPHQPNATVRPSAEPAHASRRRAMSRPGCASPTIESTTSAERLLEEIPGAAASTIPVTASGRRMAARSPTSPPSECPTQGAGSASSASSTARTASANGSTRRRRRQRRCAAVPRELGHDHAPLRGQRGREREPVRRRAAEPVDEHEGRPGAADGVAERGSAVRSLPYPKS